MRKVLKAAIALMCALVIFIPTYAFATDSGGESIMGMDSPGMDDDTARSYDYIEFGSYPQTEIVSQAKDSGVYEKEWATDSDYIIDSELYNTLAGLSEDKWDANGDTTLDGNKYRRIKKSDATGTKSEDTSTTTTDIESTKDAPASENDSVTMYYNWSSDSTYHYFKYEPIKWRILQQNGNDVFLLAEKALDCQMYCTKIDGNLTWKTSSIRSWLNGYDSSENLYSADCSDKNFIDTAFTSEEQSSIKTTTIANNNNSSQSIGGCENTSDKIYLLSEDEVYGDTATGYGFYNEDGRSITRRTTSSTYAKAMGAKSNDSTDYEGKYTGNCFWWLRSPGTKQGLFIIINDSGSVDVGGKHANGKNRGVRPAMHVDTSVVTGVSINKTRLSLVPDAEETLIATIAPTYATNQSITWSSSNESVATVDASGKVKAVASGNAIITATSTADTSKTVSCNVAVVPNAVVGAEYAASLTLKDNIDINFNMAKISDGFVKDKLVIEVDNNTLDDKEITYDSSKQEVTCVLKSVVPKNMGNPISVVVTYDGINLISFDYSIRKYCDYVFTHPLTYGLKLWNLCQAVLNYGAWADNFFNGKTDSTVNAGYVIDFSNASVSEPGYSSSLGETITKASATLDLNSKITLNFKVKYSGTLDSSKVSIVPYTTTIANNKINLGTPGEAIDSSEITVKAINDDDYNYQISITDIGASQISKAYKFTINGIADFYINYGVYNYCYTVNNPPEGYSYTDSLKTLCKAIYNYGEAASAYSASN